MVLCYADRMHTLKSPDMQLMKINIMRPMQPFHNTPLMQHLQSQAWNRSVMTDAEGRHMKGGDSVITVLHKIQDRLTL